MAPTARHALNWSAVGVVFGIVMGAGGTLIAYGRQDGARAEVVQRHEHDISATAARVDLLGARVGEIESDSKVVREIVERQSKTLDEVRQDVKRLLVRQNDKDK